MIYLKKFQDIYYGHINLHGEDYWVISDTEDLDVATVELISYNDSSLPNAIKTFHFWKKYASERPYYINYTFGTKGEFQRLIGGIVL